MSSTFSNPALAAPKPTATIEASGAAAARAFVLSGTPSAGFADFIATMRRRLVRRGVGAGASSELATDSIVAFEHAAWAEFYRLSPPSEGLAAPARPS